MKNNLLFQSKARARIELDPNQVAALCGHNEDRILRLHAHLRLKPVQYGTWYTAALAVANHLNADTGCARPAENLAIHPGADLNMNPDYSQIRPIRRRVWRAQRKTALVFLKAAFSL